LRTFADVTVQTRGAHVSLQWAAMRSHGVAAGICALAGAAMVLASTPAGAVETTFSIYVLGARTPGAGLTPPAGIYAKSYLFLYRGKYQDPVATPAGPLEGTSHVDLAVDILELEWVTRYRFAGGTPGFSLIVPYGFVGADSTVGTSFVSDSDTTIGDPDIEAWLGWQSGELHWKLGAVYNAPIGDYDASRISNLSFNRSALDLYGALTWLDPATDLEVSVDGGLIINGENAITNYQSGNELYGEMAIGKPLTKELTVGVLGYQYAQLDGDGGTGLPSDFKGRVSGLGGYVGYKQKFGTTRIETRLSVTQEFNVRDKFKGTPVLLKCAITDDSWRR
jgi:hypothetical protein